MVACSAISEAMLLRMSKPFWFRSLHFELQKTIINQINNDNGKTSILNFHYCTELSLPAAEEAETDAGEVARQDGHVVLLEAQVPHDLGNL